MPRGDPASWSSHPGAHRAPGGIGEGREGGAEVIRRHIANNLSVK